MNKAFPLLSSSLLSSNYYPKDCKILAQTQGFTVFFYTKF